jgi:translation initiation factor 2 alpha subunit (eIF-2alpha)
MIHDASVEVTCDHEGCHESVWVPLEFVYGGIMHSFGHYAHDDRKVEQRLKMEHKWIVKDGNHYCCEECAKDK